jgi:general secretion pathway protein E
VLGGLLEDVLRESNQSVPILGNIPLLGNLFRSRKTEKVKTNLMIFIRPTILRDTATIATETEKVKTNLMIFIRPTILRDTATIATETNQKYNMMRDVMRANESSDIALMPERAARGRTPVNMMEPEPEIVLEPAIPEVQAARKMLPFSFAKRHGVLIQELGQTEGKAVYRTGASPMSIAEARRFAGVPLKMSRVSAEVFDTLLQASYGQDSTKASQMVDGLDEEFDLTQVAQELQEPSDLLESDDDAPIIRFINAVLTEAIKENASDVHIEPYENRLGVRFRVDGVLREVLQTRRALAPLVVSRIKVMSKLDIAEKRLPQDGRISLRIAGRAVDVRVSTMPSGHGERVVLRLLDKQAGRLDLLSLGMDPVTTQTVDDLIHKPHGIILVTGPTGSGKTTTLYAALERINDNTRNIMTVEDPIEYFIDGIGQSQVSRDGR